MNRFHKDKTPQTASEKKRAAPMRDFSNTPWNNAPTMRQLKFHKLLYWLLPILVLLVITVGGVLLAFKFATTGATTGDVDNREIFSSSGSEVIVPELLEAYLNAIGGRDALNKVRSVRYEGTVRFATTENDFQMLLMLPDKGMLVTNPGESNNKKLMLNGDTAWQVVDRPDGTRKVLPLDEEGTQLLKWSLRVHNTFRDLALRSQYAGLNAREMQYKGKPAYELTKTMANGAKFLAILDRETLYLRKTQESVRRSAGTDQFAVEYDDHRMVSGVVEPFRTKLYRNENLDNEVLIESIRTNTGVMSSLFTIPEELQN